MEQTKNRYKMKIGQQTYTIIGPESKTHMAMVNDLVNEQLEDIMRLAPQTTDEQAAILLAINAVSDQLKKQERILTLEKQCKELEERTAHLQEVEARLQKIESVEKKAKQALKQNGNEKEPENHIEAQQILNQEVKKQIKKKK